MNDSNDYSARRGSYPGGVSTAIQKKIVSFEALNPEQRQQAERYQKILAASGAAPMVPVGLMPGTAPWDLRLLALERGSQRGSLTIVRFSDPGLSLQGEKFAEVRRIHIAMANGQVASGILERGEGDGQLWVRRRFHPRTLADVYSLEDPFQPGFSLTQFVQRAIVQLHFAHAAAILHGHICAENIGFDGDQPSLLDFAYTGFMPFQAEHNASLAPEVLRKGQPSFASDVFGLGLVLRQVFGSALSPAQANLIERMLEPEAAARPALDEVVRTFVPNQALNSSSSGNRLRKPSMIKAGKVLTPEMLAGLRTHKAVQGDAIKTVDQGGKEELAGSPALAKTADASQPIGAKKLLAPIFGVLGIALIVWALFGIGGLIFRSTTEREEKIRALWTSTQHEEVQQAIDEAVNDENELAQDVLLQEIVKQPARTGIADNLVKKAMSAEWSDEYSSKDKKLLLMLALSDLASFDPKDLPPLESAHPGLVLTIIGEFPLSRGKNHFADIAVDKLAALPNPYGEAFKELGQLGIRNFSQPSAQGFAHILLGDTSNETMNIYFGKAVPEHVFLARLLPLLNLLDRVPALANAVLSVCAARGDIFTRRAEWFDAEHIAGWEQVPARERLLLIAGLIPGRDIPFERLVDLLKFPANVVRKEAITRLLSILPGKSNKAVLEYLGSDQNRLSRFQVVSLLLASRLKGDEAYSLISRWFKSPPEPDPQAVFELLLLRTENQGTLDAFNMEAANYLTTRDWNASAEDLARLAKNPEPLARALAYSRLDPDVPEEAAILRNCATTESDPKLRKEINQKLNGADSDDSPPEPEPSNKIPQIPVFK